MARILLLVNIGLRELPSLGLTTENAREGNIVDVDDKAAETLKRMRWGRDATAQDADAKREADKANADAAARRDQAAQNAAANPPGARAPVITQPTGTPPETQQRRAGRNE